MAEAALYRGMGRQTLEREYNARESVASFEDEFAALVALSREAMADLPVEAGIVYDAASGEKLDLYGAAPGRPVFLWIHGGYWRLGTRAENAFAAPGLVAQGVAVAVMDYTLAPQVKLAEIVRQVRAAVAWLHRHGPDRGLDVTRIHVGGSSAGGHLTGMLLADGWTGDFGLPEDVIGAALAINGLHDIRPLRHIAPNEWLDLDAAEAEALSPILHIPERSGAELIAAVGGLETAEFRRQTADYLAAWCAAGHRGQEVPMPGHNHFDITGTLSDPEGPLTRATRDTITRYHA